MNNLEMVAFALGGDMELAKDLKNFKDYVDYLNQHPEVERSYEFDQIPQSLQGRLSARLCKYVSDGCFYLDNGAMPKESPAMSELYLSMVMALIE